MTVCFHSLLRNTNICCVYTCNMLRKYAQFDNIVIYSDTWKRFHQFSKGVDISMNNVIRVRGNLIFRDCWAVLFDLLINLSLIIFEIGTIPRTRFWRIVYIFDTWYTTFTFQTTVHLMHNMESVARTDGNSPKNIALITGITGQVGCMFYNSSFWKYVVNTCF